MEDKKKYRIASTVIVLCFLVVWMVVWVQKQNQGLQKSEVFSEAVVTEEIKNVIGLLDEEDYDALQAAATDAMQEFLTPEVWGEAKVQFSEDWGALVKLGKMHFSEAEQDGEPMACGQVKATYENVKVTYTLVFDRDMQLAGLYIQ